MALGTDPSSSYDDYDEEDRKAEERGNADDYGDEEYETGEEPQDVGDDYDDEDTRAWADERGRADGEYTYDEYRRAADDFLQSGADLSSATEAITKAVYDTGDVILNRMHTEVVNQGILREREHPYLFQEVHELRAEQARLHDSFSRVYCLGLAHLFTTSLLLPLLLLRKRRRHGVVAATAV